MLTFCLSMIDDTADNIRFETLYAKYKSLVMRFSLSLLNNYHDAEDVSQEAWVTVAENIKKFREQDDASVKTFLLKVTKYKAISLLRERTATNRHAEPLDEEEVERTRELCDTTLIDVCRRETEETLYECLNRLDEKYRDVLMFYYLDRNTTKEIAELLSLDVTVVRKRLERGRMMLLNLITEKYHEEI